MLRLKRIELVGFKSFCDRTVLELSGSGLTCIVGPNGCGKSNLVDAICWVLGEQNHRSLRAERMADCISNGSPTRPPMGMAEVSLTMVDPTLAEAAEKILEREAESSARDGEAAAHPSPDKQPTAAASPTPDAEPPVAPPAPRAGRSRTPRATAPGEVVITRRLYRSGQSEYLINGRAVRLRDIQELFMGMGLGPNSYAIIEQGRIGQILSSRPAERRAIIEEAAGISKYKVKKRLAETRLEAAKQNLARVEDILAEVERQLHSLKRQASRARRYQELREQMHGLLAAVTVTRWRRLEAERRALAEQHASLQTRETQLRQAVTATEAEQQQLQTASEQQETLLRQLHNQLGQATLAIERSQARLETNTRESQQLAARLDALERNHEELLAAGQRLKERQAATAAELERLRQAHALQQHLADQLSAQAEHWQSQQQELNTQRQALLRERDQCITQLASLQTQQAQMAEAARRLAAALEAELEAAGQCERQQQQKSTQYTELEDRIHRLRDSVHAQRQRLAEIQAAWQQRHEHWQQELARSTRAREALAAAEERRQTLQRILQERMHTPAAVQQLLSLNGQGTRAGFRARGLLADFTDVEPGYEIPVEQFLHDELGYIVVETYNSARAGICLLDQEIGGRATFLVDSLPPTPAPACQKHPVEALPTVLGRLDRVVRFRPPLGEAVKSLLPRLATAFLVENTEAAQALAAEHPELHFVALDGTWFRGRLVSGGRAGEAGPFVLKRALEETAEHCRTLAAELAAIVHRCTELGRETHLLESQLDETRGRLLEDEKQLALLEQELAQLRQDLAQIEVSRHEQQQRRAQLEVELATTEHTQRQLQSQQEQLAERKQHLEASLPAVEAQCSQAAAELSTVREQLAGVRVSLAAQQEQIAYLEQTRSQLEHEQAELDAQLDHLARQRELLLAQQQQLAADSAAAQQELLHHRPLVEALNEQILTAEQQMHQLRLQVAQLAERARTHRQQLDELLQQRSQVEIEQARLQAELAHVREATQNELGRSLEELAASYAPLPEEELATAEANYRELRQRLDTLGPVNPLALEEYTECEKRYQFLVTERDDLVRSIADTEKAIAELDAISHTKFTEALTTINRHFADAFRALFGGGTGEVRLGEPDSSGQPGLEIVVQPPGKRLQSLLLLSGGEKALTALALLIAIFRYQSSPFCVLDEVDAPLDESNITRFLQMLQEMSTRTQFVVVTHNRRTMEAASVLYGVTMQEPGVSKIISVRWEQPASQVA